MYRLALAALAALALTAGACATPSKEKSSADGIAGATARAGPGPQSGAGGEEKAKGKKPWWQLSQYKRDTGLRPIEPQGMRPGRGLFSGEDGHFVIYGKRESRSPTPADTANPGKPTKVRR